MATARRKCHGVMAMTDDSNNPFPMSEFATVGGASSSSGTDIGSVTTSDIYITADSLAWLVEQVRGDSTLYADTVELEVSDGGTLVFSGDGDGIVVSYTEGADD